MKKGLIKKISTKTLAASWAQTALFFIISYFLAVLGWQVFHKIEFQNVGWLKGFGLLTHIPPLPVIVSAFVIFLILLIFNFLFQNLKPSRLISLRPLVLAVFILYLAIKMPAITSHLEFMASHKFTLIIWQFLSQVWFWQNLVLVLTVSFFVTKYLLSYHEDKIEAFFKSKFWLILLILMAIIFYSLLSIGKHNNLQSSTMDLGGYDQVIWEFSRFKSPRTTVYPAEKILNGQIDVSKNSYNELKTYFPNILGDHFEPILALISPLYWLWSDPKLLLFFQAVVICLGAWPIYLIAQDKLKSNLGALFAAASYLFFIGVQIALEFDFHPLTLVPPLLALLYYLLEKKKMTGVIITAAVALLCKEVVSLYILFFGLYALVRRQWKVGLILILMGIGWYILTIDIIIPKIFGRQYGHISAYANLGASAFEIIKSLVSRPLYIINTLFTPETKIFSWLAIFGSTAFLAFLSPATLILAIPMLGEKFLTASKENLWLMWWHYTSTIAPIIIIAALGGIAWLNRKFHRLKINWPLFGAMAMLLSTLSVSFVYYFRHPSFPAPLVRIFSPRFYQKRPDIKDFDELKKLIPKDASVAAQDTLLPHLAHRLEIYRISPSVPKAKYVILDKSLESWPISNKEVRQIIAKFQHDPDYILKANKGDIFLFERKY